MVRTKKKQNKRTGRGGGRWGMGEIVINPLNRNGIYFIDYENGEHTVRPLGRMGRKCAQLTGEFPRLMTPFTRWTPAVSPLSFQFFFFLASYFFPFLFSSRCFTLFRSFGGTVFILIIVVVVYRRGCSSLFLAVDFFFLSLFLFFILGSIPPGSFLFFNCCVVVDRRRLNCRGHPFTDVPK